MFCFPSILLPRNVSFITGYLNTSINRFEVLILILWYITLKCNMRIHYLSNIKFVTATE